MRRVVIAIAVLFGAVWAWLLVRSVFWPGSDEVGLWRAMAWVVTLGALLWLCRDLQRTRRK